MPNYQYLIVGGGMTAESALHGIREVDPNGSIGLISSESHPPYDRPPLSKGLWKGKPLEKIWRDTANLNAELHLGRSVQTLDAHNNRLTDDQGETYTYEKLLLATGGSPIRLPFGGDDIIYFRNLDDYQRLKALTDSGQRFAVIGGGFIGSEIAAALAMVGKDVVMLFPEKGIGERTFPQDLSAFLNDYYREKKVEVLADELVTGLQTDGKQYTLRTRSQHDITVDGVIAGIGIRPNTALAEAAHLTVENGIVVDEFMRTSQPNIYAAGDAAAFFNPHLGKRVRVEHEDNANTMGKMAGQAMAGQPVPYHHLPFFYSDLFDLGYEAVGELDSHLETVADWKDPFHKGIIYYLRDDRVVGVLLWDVWGQVDAARALMAENGPFRAADLRGKIPIS
jgi:3-phenylpropionate/trans-cinnamate dioxygenase ferredoxin reductase component